MVVVTEALVYAVGYDVPVDRTRTQIADQRTLESIV